MANMKENEEHYNRTLQIFLRIGFVSLLLLTSYVILKPFLILIVWSIIIAISIYPLFKKLAKLLGNRDKLASIIITFIAVSVIIIPSSLFLGSTLDGVQSLRQSFKAGEDIIPDPPQNVAEWPLIGKPVYETWKLASDNLGGAIEAFKPQIKEYGHKLIDILTGFGGTILFTVIALIIAGVLLMTAEASEKVSIKIFSYLAGNNGKSFTNLIILTVRSVVQGILGVSAIQSALAGILMLYFNVPGAGLWALLVLFLAIMQIPPTIIMLPIAIYEFSVLETTSAIIFLVLAMIISASDAALKPLFLGRGVDVPMLVVLLGAIGGMIAFGILGLFVGAVVLAVTYKVFQAMQTA